jgi:transcription elongation factor Elf1
MRKILKEGAKKEIKKFVCEKCGEEWETDGWVEPQENRFLSSCNNCGKIAEDITNFRK